MIEPEKVDFTKVIAEIEAAGITTHKLATMMHRQYVQIKRWKRGSEPRHYEGQMLLIIHGEYAKAEKKEIALGDTDSERMVEPEVSAMAVYCTYGAR